ncbi:phosphate acyltransferase PlsX [bacterium]|nr:phosphate acyltransferase PlsX [bacterium]
MAQRPTLILDIMGADLGAAEMLRGALLAVRQGGREPFNLVLVGSASHELRTLMDEELLPAAERASVEVELLEAPDELPKHFDSPMEAYRNYRQSSVRLAMERARQTPSSAVVSPGSTGLVMIAAMMTLGRVTGIDRAPIGTPMPTKLGELFYVDGGSNVECRAVHLYQFAVLAHLYVKNIKGIERPKVGLLSNGSEDYKGTPLLKEAYELIAADKDLNFIGYIEGHSMLEGVADVMVCDGFIGNVILKFAEGAADLMLSIIREEMRRNPLAGLAARMLQRNVWNGVRRRLDYTQFGGAPLLGLNGNVVICHGRSPAVAIKNALGLAYSLATSDIAGQVAQYVASHEKLNKPAAAAGG